MNNEYYNHNENENDYNPEQYQSEQSSGDSNQSSNNKKTSKVIAIVAIAAVVLALGGTYFSFFQGMNPAVGTSGNGTKEDVEIASTLEDTKLEEATTVTVVEANIADVVEAVMPSVVSITNMSVQQVENWFYGGYQEYESQSSGSGIIIGENETELLILTNNHVVENNKTLTVTFIDEKSVNAKVKGADASSDLAIIVVDLADIEADTKKAIKHATIGDSNNLRVGEPAIAIGNALGYGQSVTAGIISALQRDIEGFDCKFIQTDAAINPGNSGGALLNAKGELVGINTAKVQDTAIEGMGYAIPISDVDEILDVLVNRETREKVEEAKRGMLGIEGSTIDAMSAQMFNVPEGVVVANVVEGGGAEAAGIISGTIITKLNDITIKTMEELQEELTYYAYGEKVKLTVWMPKDDRSYEEKVVEVVLQKKNPQN